ncbi:NU160-like protein [Mya arenaria]|uniref:NU160-like protein n=1 Tax=Mya arenaria TaxID=6604 RepID=A0ABY7DXP6_MYAAR|nr:NU160-like protein [Mya arenaria]
MLVLAKARTSLVTAVRSLSRFLWRTFEAVNSPACIAPLKPHVLQSVDNPGIRYDSLGKDVNFSATFLYTHTCKQISKDEGLSQQIRLTMHSAFLINEDLRDGSIHHYTTPVLLDNLNNLERDLARPPQWFHELSNCFLLFGKKFLSISSELFLGSTLERLDVTFGKGEELRSKNGGHRKGKKANGDILELIEESLDHDLYASKVKFHFQDMSILGGVSVHESHGYVIVLVPTVASVHRLVFPHPSKLYRREAGYIVPDQPIPSIFHDASITKCMDSKNSHMLNPAGTLSSVFTCAGSFCTQEGEALFALGNTAGNILLVKMPPLGMQGIVQQFELCQTSVMQKLWTGLVPSMMRGGQEPAHTVSSLVIQAVSGEACVFAMCKDSRLRIWSCKSHESVLTCNILDFTPGSGHSIRKITSNNTMHPAASSDNKSSTNHSCCHEDGPGQWVEALLQVPEMAELPVPAHKDPREVYLQHIFQPGRFSREDIRKALNNCNSIPQLQVYSRSLDPNVVGEAALNVNTLRQDIRSAAVDYEMEEEEYYQLQLDQWTKSVEN